MRFTWNEFKADPKKVSKAIVEEAFEQAIDNYDGSLKDFEYCESPTDSEDTMVYITYCCGEVVVGGDYKIGAAVMEELYDQYTNSQGFKEAVRDAADARAEYESEMELRHRANLMRQFI